MPIRYALHPNKLTGNPDDYLAIVHFTRSVDEWANNPLLRALKKSKGLDWLIDLGVFKMS